MINKNRFLINREIGKIVSKLLSITLLINLYFYIICVLMGKVPLSVYCRRSVIVTGYK